MSAELTTAVPIEDTLDMYLEIRSLRSALLQIKQYINDESIDDNFKLSEIEKICDEAKREDKLYKQLVEHKKTGKWYHLWMEALNCTNAQDGQKMVIYSNENGIFVREQKEFVDKFCKLY